MSKMRIAWLPAKPFDHSAARDAIARYVDFEATFVLFENGTALMLKPELDRPEVIRGAMTELKFKTDFKVMPMQDKNFLVWLASPVCVFISADDAAACVADLKRDPSRAMFPGESFASHPKDPNHLFIGLAGRARAHADAVGQIQVARYAPDET